MIILDVPRPFDGSTITIPLYHRGHVALFPQTTVWSCLLPGSPRNETHPGSPRNGTLAELVISPVDFGAWNELYRISGTFHDRPGLVHDLVDALMDFDIIVLTAESSAMARQQQHSVELIVDAQSYTRHSPSPGHDPMAEVRRALLARVFDDVELSDQDEEQLTISRVQHLRQASSDYADAGDEHRRSRGPRPAYGPVRVESPHRGKVLLTLSPAQQAVLAALKGANETVDESGYHYLLVSETGDRFLRAYFIPDSEPIIWARIGHAQEPGALAAITGAMKHAGFNILTSLARLHRHGESAEFETVLQGPGRAMSREALQARLEAALSTDEVCAHRVGICYPRGYGYADDTLKPLTPAPQQHLLLLGEERESAPHHTDGLRLARRSQTTDQILNEKVRDYGAKIKQPVPPRDAPARLKLARELLRQGAGVCFLSYHFDDGGVLAKKISERNKRGVGMKLVDGRDLNHGVHRDGIIERMRGCTHFLGIWTAEGGKRVSTRPPRWWPSPWMHWELGAAQTLGLTWHLLIDARIDERAWKRLVADNAHTIFTEATSSRSLGRAWKILSSAPRPGTGPRAGAARGLR
ncbi:MAG: hypothetical protein ACJ8GN_00035 [Longimicrobiaceae bacterium]